jgi:hypothetical protein
MNELGAAFGGADVVAGSALAHPHHAARFIADQCRCRGLAAVYA